MESSSNNPAAVQSLDETLGRMFNAISDVGSKVDSIVSRVAALEDRDRPAQPSDLKRKHSQSATSTPGPSPAHSARAKDLSASEDEDPIYEGDDDEEMDVDAAKRLGDTKYLPKPKSFSSRHS